MTKLRQAVTTKAIAFVKNGNPVEVPEGSQIEVNVKEYYGQWQGMTFDVFKEEYKIVRQVAA